MCLEGQGDLISRLMEVTDSTWRAGDLANNLIRGIITWVTIWITGVILISRLILGISRVTRWIVGVINRLTKFSWPFK